MGSVLTLQLPSRRLLGSTPAAPIRVGCHPSSISIRIAPILESDLPESQLLCSETLIFSTQPYRGDLVLEISVGRRPVKGERRTIQRLMFFIEIFPKPVTAI